MVNERDSWRIIHDNVILKRADKSSIESNESIIPIGKRHFFKIENMLPDTCKEITICVNDRELTGRIAHRCRKSKKTSKVDGTYTKISWNSYLSIFLKNFFTDYPNFKSADVPVLVFERINDTYYIVTVESGSDFINNYL